MADCNSADIYICGVGLKISDHLTLETIEALERCSIIFSIFQAGTQNLLPASFRDRFHSLWPYYKPGLLRQDAYSAQIEVVVEAASSHAPVAYLTQGNPIFFDSVTAGILKEGANRGLTVKIFPAISSIDTIMIDLQQDIAPGIQIYDSSAVVAYKIALRVDIACLLVQPNTFGTSYVAADRHPLTEAMRPLREHLLLYYPPDHELTYVTSATAPGRNAILSRFPLKDLGGTKEAPQVPGGSLFIPPASPLQADDQFVSKMFDTRRLTEMYRSRKNNGNQEF